MDEQPVAIYEALCIVCDDDDRGPALPESSSPTPPAKRQNVEEYPPPPPKSRRIGGIYRVSEGVYKKWTGKAWKMQCCACISKKANYPDKSGQKKFCAGCARDAGTYAVRNPCRDCPVYAKREAGYNDEAGRCNKLCADHARDAGTYAVRNPCRDCPADAKLEANYDDETGRYNKLCADHARDAGTYTVQNPCRDCPADAKLEAGYNDEAGRCNKLCADHARDAGTYTVQNPCRDCPADAKLEAGYNDEAGRRNKLCAGCAFEAGLKPLAAAGASMTACECWHRLEFVSNAKLTHHVHIDKDSTIPIGKEKEGLIPGRRFRPDAFIEAGMPIHLPHETSGPKGAVYLYHGNEWHGYPQGHHKHEARNHLGIPYKELYERTLREQKLYKDEGYCVFVVWEHEYQTTKRTRCPVNILNVVRKV